MRKTARVCGVLLAGWMLAGAAHSAGVRTDRASLPRKILWVWERPEDLRGLPGGVGLAVLEATVRLGAGGVRVVPRRQPVVLPVGAVRVRVVRIEAAAAFLAHPEDRALTERASEQVGELIAEVGQEAGTAAVQIDFDARRSEREFYRRLLTRARKRMPEAVPLTMTALVSWCSADDWLGSLPVAEATPMFFRMEPDRRRLVASGDEPEFRVREPLCMGSVGVSTGEPWPGGLAGKRVYVFAENGWARELKNLSRPGVGDGR
jgi:hypothetical protein